MAQLQVIFMDAGQGDCTLIVYPDKTLTLVDCGSIKNGRTVSSEISQVIQRFAAANHNVINNVVLTHPDADHYNLLETCVINPGYTVNHVYYGGDRNLYSSTVSNWLNGIKGGSPPHAFGGSAPDAELSRKGVDVYVLAANMTGYPKDGSAIGKNRNSIVLMVKFDESRIFLMGDSDTETENFIIQGAIYYKLPDLLPRKKGQSVLKLGHHGSLNSTGTAWLQTIKPNTVFVSSDTRTFSGTGMPSQTLFDHVAANTTLDSELPQNHSFVIFNDNLMTPDFELVGPNKLEWCSTLYNLTPDPYIANGFEATGGSWYYILDDTNASAAFQFTGW